MKFTILFSWAFLGIAVISFIFFSSIVSLVTDWWWYQEVGLTEVFTTSLTAKAVVGFTAGLLAVAFLLLNLYLAVRSKIPWMVAIPASLIGTNQPISLNSRIVSKLGIILSCAVALFIGLIASSSWHDVLKFLSSVPF
ncbi:MAG: UPF0182 family protein, partial [Patescibacteria group bacterium]